MKNFSIVIPVYNEQEILKRQIDKIISKIKKLNLASSSYEIIIVENGSTDSTYQIAKRLAKDYKQLKVLKINQPSYGQALRQGIKEAKYNLVYQFDIDFWSIEFLKKSLDLIDNYDIIIGSKNLLDSDDQRPIIRKLFSKLIEIAIKYWFRVNITDTHGQKLMRKEKIIDLIDKINSPNHFYDSELLVRAFYLNYRFKEIPVSLKEIRKSRFAYHLRFFEVVGEFKQLLSLKKSILSNPFPL